MQIIEFYSQPKTCSYISSKQSYFWYMYIKECRGSFYNGLLERGWRRFGEYFFVPICESCRDCISIRQVVSDFSLSKNQKHVVSKNKNTKLIITKPKINDKKLALYDKYHKRMNEKKGWEYSGIDYESYKNMFVDGFLDFGYEFDYYIDDKLVGVGFVDAVLESMSAVYFFYDHDYERLSLGTYNILTQLNIAKEKGFKYFYPGYWIKDHYSMGYKERFKPFETLLNTPDLFDIPIWQIYHKEKNENNQ